MDKNYPDTFLARWLNNELTEDEKSSFEASEDFLLYKKIAEKSSELIPPKFNKDKIYKEILAKTNLQKEKKVVPLFRAWYAVAASIALLLGFFYFVNLSKKITTDFGEQLTIILPDNSKILLNSKSKISYQKKNWKKNRVIKLEGEALFKVKKGSTFTVETQQGNITVLGTEFNVKTSKNLFEVICFEGKVKTEHQNQTNILTKGKAIRQIGTKIEKWNTMKTSPSWINGETSFNSMPLQFVIDAIENQYNITINTSKIDTNKRFTGSFTHSNLEVALQTVFVPMKIGVIFKDDKTVLLENQ